MPYSRIIKIGDGSTKQFAVNFALGILSENDVRCRVGAEVDGSGNPLYRPLTFLSPNFVQVGGTAAGTGVRVVFERTVDKENLNVNFSDGDVLPEENLDDSQKQALMAIHEVFDGRFNEFTDDLDLGGYRVKNLGDPVNSSDAATKQYVQNTVSQLDSISTQIVQLAGIRDNITEVAGIADDLTTVANVSGDVSILADNVDMFTGAYSALYGKEYLFTGNGTTTVWGPLDNVPVGKDNLDVFIGGAIQKSSDFELVGNTVVLTPAVETGTEIIVKYKVQVSSTELLDLVDSAAQSAANAEAFADESQSHATQALAYVTIANALAFDFNFDSAPGAPGYDWNT